MGSISQQWLVVGIMVVSLEGAGALAQANPAPLADLASGVPVVQVNPQETPDQLFDEGMQIYQEGSATSLQQAMEKWQRALQLYQSLGDSKGEGKTLLSIGGSYIDIGQLQEALNYLYQALPILQEVGEALAILPAIENRNQEVEAGILMNIGNVYKDIGQPQATFNYYHQALPIFREVGDRRGEALTLMNIGNVYSDIGQPQVALNYYHQALPIFQVVGDRRTEATNLMNIGNSYLLQYTLGQDRSYLWLVTPTEITSYSLPSEADIQKVVNKLRDAITNPRHRHRPVYIQQASQAVSEILLSPLASQLQNKRLVIVADGILQYLPFAALSDPTLPNNYQPLFVNHEIVNLPSASTLAIIRQQTRNRQLAPHTFAILADPVFSPQDERLQQSTDVNNIVNLDLNRAANNLGISMPPTRLPFTRHEAETILALVPDSQEFSAIDFEASRATATANTLSQYQIVHFATHGFVDSLSPELSGIVLSLVDENGNPEDGFLRLHDIYNLNLPAELVVLSACQTGLGENIRGEGLVGLTRGFMYAGSKRVLVSLWSVSDEGTSKLMSSFYQGYLQQGLTPSAALRQAQLQMWQSQSWSAPFYWAAFTLQGEWR